VRVPLHSPRNSTHITREKREERASANIALHHDGRRQRRVHDRPAKGGAALAGRAGERRAGTEREGLGHGREDGHGRGRREAEWRRRRRPHSSSSAGGPDYPREKNFGTPLVGEFNQKIRDVIDEFAMVQGAAAVRDRNVGRGGGGETYYREKIAQLEGTG